MSATPPDFDEIRKRIEKRYDQRAEMLSHTIAFVVVNGFVWGAWLLTDPLARMTAVIPAALTILWFVGFAIHGVQYLTAEARERAIEQALEREREWYYQGEHKAKRDRLTRLTDDGELVEVVEDEEELGDRRKR
jgi:hypothetical protein